MTITCQPMDATAGAPAYSAQNERQNMAPLFGGGGGVVLGARSGWRVGTPSNILSVTSTAWTLGPSSAVITPGAATAQGSYRWATDANITAANNLTPPDATYDRKDIVYIQVNDSSSGDGSGALTAPVLYLAGAATATPVAPTLPARSFLVGTITVPKVGGGSPTVIRNPAVFVAAGGILPVADGSEQAPLTQYPGSATSRGGILELSDGSAWNRPGPKVIPSPASQVGAGLASTAFTTGTNIPIIQVGTVVVTTDASGYFSITYPAAFPNGVLMVAFTSGDASVGRNIVLATAGTPFTQSLSTAYGSAVTGSNVPFASTAMRINYFAVGF